MPRSVAAERRKFRTFSQPLGVGRPSRATFVRFRIDSRRTACPEWPSRNYRTPSRNFRGGDPLPRGASTASAPDDTLPDRRARPAGTPPWRGGVDVGGAPRTTSARVVRDRGRPTRDARRDATGGREASNAEEEPSSPTGLSRTPWFSPSEEVWTMRYRHRIAVLLGATAIVLSACSGGATSAP